MNEELQKLKEEFEQRIRELKDKYKPEGEWPEGGDDYWYIIASGEVSGSFWAYTMLDKQMLEFGNIFKTESEAEFMVEKLKVIKELKQLARPFKVGSVNHLIDFDPLDMDFIISSFQVRQSAYGDFYFNTEEEAQQAITIIGEDRIKKYLFGVKEGDSK